MTVRDRAWADEEVRAIGACGDDCGFCPRYVATASGDPGELEKVKDLWVRLGWRDRAFPAQSLACHGCGPRNDCAYPELRDCVRGRAVARCGLCPDYPCALTTALFARSDHLRLHARQVCTHAEMTALDQAFFSKRLNMERTQTA